MDWTALKLMLEGIEVKRQLKRYRRASNEVESGGDNSAASLR